MDFTEVREYQFGDDVRLIDWNVSARFDRPFLKVFQEERELTVMLIADFSGSQQFGSTAKFKREIAAELCAVLAFSAIKNNDKVGLIIFTDRIEKFIPPKKGKSHILRIIREFLAFEPKGSGTDISLAMSYFVKVVKKRCIAFLVSDFIDSNFEQPIRIAGRKHDLIAMRLHDRREAVMPDVGLVKLHDAETGREVWIDTSNRHMRHGYTMEWTERMSMLDRSLRRANIDVIDVDIAESYIQPLVKFFRMRERRR
jgi:uncharacterized protein (DUF58 family)